MKRVLSIILSVVMVLCLLPTVAFPAVALTEGYYTYSVSNGEATITDVSTSISGAVTIPSTLGEYPVTSIGYRAFSLCKNITSVVVPEGITRIESRAFEYCTSLWKATFPTTLAYIGLSAFSNLQAVYISDVSAWCSIYFEYKIHHDTYEVNQPSLEEWCGPYGTYYLYLNRELVTDLVIPEGISDIPATAFSGCRGLTSITIPSTVKSIGFEALACDYQEVYISDITAWCSLSFDRAREYYMYSLYYGVGGSRPLGGRKLYLNGAEVVNLIIPEGVSYIGDLTFAGCSSIKSVTIPESVTSIGNYAFDACNIEEITIPSNVAKIGVGAFSSKYALSMTVDTDNLTYHSIDNCIIETKGKTLALGCRNSIIPDNGSVTSIGAKAFYGCTELSQISIPDGVTDIGAQAFAATGLTSVSIPKSVKKMADQAFDSCRKLESVHITDIAAWCAISFSYTSVGDGHHMPYDYSIYGYLYLTNPLSYAGKLYLNKELVTNLIIPKGVTSVNAMAFYGCDSITSVSIPPSVKSIGYFAFGGAYRDSPPSNNLTEVWYSGSRQTAIEIDAGNQYLKDATWHYNVCTGEHAYDNACDTTCNNCDFPRSIQHSYDNDCDALCNICGESRTVGEHIYDNTCDTVCNVCGYIREIEHTYDNTCDTVCNICGHTRAIEHTYDAATDAVCNVCGYTRMIPHTPPAPEMIEVTHTTVTLQQMTSYEYSLDGTNWQSSSTFTGLTPGVSYTFYQRVTETETRSASETSPVLQITTLAKSACPNEPVKPVVVDSDSYFVELRAIDGYEYKCGSGSWQDSPYFGGLSRETAYTFYQRIKATTTTNASEISVGLTYTTLTAGLSTVACYNLLWSHIGDSGSYYNGYKCIKLTKDSRYIYMVQQPDSIFFFMEGFSGTSLSTMETTVAFALKPYETEIVTYCTIGMYYTSSGNLISEAEDFAAIDRSTYSDATVLNMSTWEYGSSFSNLYHNYLLLLCLYISEYCYDNLYFPITALGFFQLEADNGFDDYKFCDPATGYHKGKQVLRYQYGATCDSDGYTGDTCCDECNGVIRGGSVIASNGGHQYSNACDTSCSECGWIRDIVHSYSDDCDTTCNVCSTQRTPNHLYDDCCDELCNECGDQRKAPHIYDDSKDLTCNNCGFERPPYTPGDIDGVEGINDRDAVYMLMNSFFPDDYPLNQSGDFDGDGFVNDRDAIYLLMYSFFPDDYPLMNN